MDERQFSKIVPRMVAHPTRQEPRVPMLATRAAAIVVWLIICLALGALIGGQHG